MRLGRSLLFLFLLGSFGSSVFAQQADFVVVAEVINPVVKPKGALDALRDCAKNDTCRKAVEAAAAYLGVDPKIVGAGLAKIPVVAVSGEEGRFIISLPAGYQYCRSTIQTVSVVPATGDRASVMGATSNRTGIGVYTWTPKQGVGGGRSWVEANYTIYGVRDAIADQQRSVGKCRPYDKSLISCRGARGTNKGMPSCGTVSD